MKKPTKKASPRRIRKVATTFPIATRRFKVSAHAFGVKPADTDSFVRVWDGLPHLLAADSLKEVVGSIAKAR